MLIFSRPGYVKVLDFDSGSIPGMLNGGNQMQMTPALPSQRVIITAVGYNQDSNIQFMHTLENSVFVYVFGDRIGDIQIQGVAFWRSCDASGNSDIGINDLLTYYETNRAVKTKKTVSISIGSKTILGYLTSCRVQTMSTEFMTMSFSLTIVALPFKEVA